MYWFWRRFKIFKNQLHLQCIVWVKFTQYETHIHGLIQKDSNIKTSTNQFQANSLTLRDMYNVTTMLIIKFYNLATKPHCHAFFCQVALKTNQNGIGKLQYWLVHESLVPSKKKRTLKDKLVVEFLKVWKVSKW
jgi:hypothetical protein